MSPKCNSLSTSSILGLKVSGPKTKIIFHGSDQPPRIYLQGSALEVVPSFKYLGSLITGCTSASTEDIHSRIGKAAGVYSSLRAHLWNRPEISLRTKMRIYNTMVIPVLLYGCETWTLNAADLNCLEVFQSTRLRWITGTSLRDRISNATMRERCHNQPTIEGTIRNHRLRWFGHICRMSPDRLPLQILNSVPPRNWRVSRNAPRKTWIDQIKTDLNRLHWTVVDAKTAALNRSQWRAIIRDIPHAAQARTATMPYRRWQLQSSPVLVPKISEAYLVRGGGLPTPLYQGRTQDFGSGGGPAWTKFRFWGGAGHMIFTVYINDVKTKNRYINRLWCHQIDQKSIRVEIDLTSIERRAKARREKILKICTFWL